MTLTTRQEESIEDAMDRLMDVASVLEDYHHYELAGEITDAVDDVGAVVDADS